MLDLFGGSGSTLIAAEQTGRWAFLMGLDPLYCDVIVIRWQNFTEREAEQVYGEISSLGAAAYTHVVCAATGPQRESQPHQRDQDNDSATRKPIVQGRALHGAVQRG